MAKIYLHFTLLSSVTLSKNKKIYFTIVWPAPTNETIHITDIEPSTEHGSSTFWLKVKYALARYWSDHNRVKKTTLKIYFYP